MKMCEMYFFDFLKSLRDGYKLDCICYKGLGGFKEQKKYISIVFYNSHDNFIFFS